MTLAREAVFAVPAPLLSVSAAGSDEPLPRHLASSFPKHDAMPPSPAAERRLRDDLQLKISTRALEQHSTALLGPDAASRIEEFVDAADWRPDC